MKASRAPAIEYIKALVLVLVFMAVGGGFEVLKVSS